MVRLRDLGEWSGGKTPSKANAAYWTNGTVPWVSPKDMKVDEIISLSIAYALFRRGKLYYVGLASDLRGRLRTHVKDHHGAS
jgi:restriction endonuclease S subunit